MELSVLLERMKMEHLAAQLDTVCEQAAAAASGSRCNAACAAKSPMIEQHKAGVQGKPAATDGLRNDPHHV